MKGHAGKQRGDLLRESFPSVLGKDVSEAICRWTCKPPCTAATTGAWVLLGFCTAPTVGQVVHCAISAGGVGAFAVYSGPGPPSRLLHQPHFDFQF